MDFRLQVSVGGRVLVWGNAGINSKGPALLGTLALGCRAGPQVLEGKGDGGDTRECVTPRDLVSCREDNTHTHTGLLRQ